MRTRLLVLIIATTLLASCGGDDDADSSASGRSTSTSEASTDAGDDGTSGAAVDCEGLQATQQLLVGVQLLAQIRTQDQVDGLKSGVPPFDPDAFIEAMEELRPLEAFEEAPFDKVDEGIDIYISAAEAAKTIFANDGPVPQADFDALEAITGPLDEVGTFLAFQSSIGVALDKACDG